MTRILAIDTSSAWCSVALSLDDAAPFVRRQRVSAGASQLLLPWIDELLVESEIKMASLDAIAVDVGPGAFTGVRLGVAVVQGLATAIKLPVISVASLDAIAAQLIEAPSFRKSQAQSFVVAVDARMGEVYWAKYITQEENLPARIGDIQLSAPESVDLLGTEFVAGSAIAEFGDRLFTSLGAPLPLERMDAEIAVDALGVLACAKMQWTHGNQQDVHLLEPLYVRNKVAFTSAERSQQNE
ncbi:tRNA (adenosine(37)-N6)-threonylcarbamoyltransferase complex dimerization subunit type 1 TsaB [Polynucleobacter sp. AP-Nino-20-G2]|uniref:tRNA (adenosine(37)-N6)-threonylcarbamoyltransferase complex dimerization subunit type 1 TsaB n=1 Tax=Polynucleobacter sp. AP-Nino-20-G2 TaxID=2576917 RepID=UPI001BFE8CC8|nr:tRNA (adenosine(37)-N6)-threonylcarbamoyltransferase complex dimerization subunit type 1 TsaB [Polynucleobacter sp. AP-Nino-20-G2]QWE17563.1 tRNA (adenosine(37)-N6)-threonylcarbamoyltransferase complex dimerization subunit type 1 TsaB [Polynucleobacter sp. AP-Nino-20-G2]